MDNLFPTRCLDQKLVYNANCPLHAWTPLCRVCTEESALQEMHAVLTGVMLLDI